MRTFFLRPRATASAILVLLSTTIVTSQQDQPPADRRDPVDPGLFRALQWRLIGPFRGGRVSAGAIDRDPNTYYIGTPGGGVWKTVDAGQVWMPIFDQVRVASIGAIAVAEADSNIIYVGTGEQTPGNGVYKSVDAGRTWTTVGLADTHVIGDIVIDPSDPSVVMVAAIGDRTSGPNRGVFKSTNGGRTWTKVLYKEDAGGSASLVAAPDDPSVMYATIAGTSGGRGGGAAGGAGAPAGAVGGGRGSAPGVLIYKSADEGTTWVPVGGRGLPASISGRQAIAVAVGTRGRRVFVNLRDGLYVSDDGGDTWRRSTTDPRIAGIGVIADPKNPDVLYVTQTSMYRSTDGGRTFESLVGAPSGDDFRLLWVDRHNSGRLLAGVDQGGIVSVDGGATWSSWYNQPTGQLYHVSTDTAFPYHVYAAQQDSGTVALPSRSDYGEISDRERYSIGGFEYGFIVADPVDPNLVYSQGWYRTVLRFDRTTGQIVHLFVPGTKYRTANMVPLAFSPQDPHTLYLGTQYVLATHDGGIHWAPVSPDLTEHDASLPGAAPGAEPPTGQGAAAGAGRGPAAPPAAIATLSPSTAKRGAMWVGTTNGIVQFTPDGTSWHDATPSELPARAVIAAVEAGRHDASTAFVVAGVPNDSHPYAWRTHDNGQTWKPITAGLDPSIPLRVIREDPVRKGLLYAGTETTVYVSFDAGDRWQSLQLNLPTSSMRDLEVHSDDLVVATYGRSIWILDDLTPLREIDDAVARSDVHLFRPAPAVRVRWDMNQDTPLPLETAAGKNPPDGAIIDYYLQSPPRGELTLTIRDSQGVIVRRYSSVPPAAGPMLPANVPEYWFAPAPVPTKSAGHNRFVWNLRYPNPKVLPFSYYGNILTYVEYTLADHAIPGETPRDQPEGPLVVPGEYVVELSVDGRTSRQNLTVRPDPRVHASQFDLVDQLALAERITDELAGSYDTYGQVTALRTAITQRTDGLQKKSGGGAAAGLARQIADLDAASASVMTGSAAAPGVGPVNRDLARYFTMLESGDARPSETLRAAAHESCLALVERVERWRQLNAGRLPAVNAALQKSGLDPLPAAAAVRVAPCE